MGGYPGVTDENRAQKLTIELQVHKHVRLCVWGGFICMRVWICGGARAFTHSHTYAYPHAHTSHMQNGRLAMLGVFGILCGDVVAPGTMGLPTPDGIGLF